MTKSESDSEMSGSESESESEDERMSTSSGSDASGSESDAGSDSESRASGSESGSEASDSESGSEGESDDGSSSDSEKAATPAREPTPEENERKRKRREAGAKVRAERRAVRESAAAAAAEAAARGTPLTSTLLNAHIKELNPDHYYHLGLSSSSQLKTMFGDVRFVILSGSAVRAHETIHKVVTALNIHLPLGCTVTPIGKTERYSLYKAGPVLSVSHGMGKPSISIMLHEITKLLAAAGAIDQTTYLRIGTSGGLGCPPGTVIVSSSTVNGTLEPTYPVVVLGQTVHRPCKIDPELVSAIMSVPLPQKSNYKMVKGITMATDDFYEGQGRLDGAICEYNVDDKMRFLKKAYAAGVRNIEMESDAIVAFCTKLHIKCAVICTTIIDRLAGDQVTSTPAQLVEFTDHAVQVALRYIQKQLHIKPGKDARNKRAVRLAKAAKNVLVHGTSVPTVAGSSEEFPAKTMSHAHTGLPSKKSPQTPKKGSEKKKQPASQKKPASEKKKAAPASEKKKENGSAKKKAPATPAVAVAVPAMTSATAAALAALAAASTVAPTPVAAAVAPVTPVATPAKKDAKPAAAAASEKKEKKSKKTAEAATPKKDEKKETANGTASSKKKKDPQTPAAKKDAKEPKTPSTSQKKKADATPATPSTPAAAPATGEKLNRRQKKKASDEAAAAEKVAAEQKAAEEARIIAENRAADLAKFNPDAVVTKVHRPTKNERKALKEAAIKAALEAGATPPTSAQVAAGFNTPAKAAAPTATAATTDGKKRKRGGDDAAEKKEEKKTSTEKKAKKSKKTDDKEMSD